LFLRCCNGPTFPLHILYTPFNHRALFVYRTWAAVVWQNVKAAYEWTMMWRMDKHGMGMKRAGMKIDTAGKTYCGLVVPDAVLAPAMPVPSIILYRLFMQHAPTAPAACLTTFATYSPAASHLPHSVRLDVHYGLRVFCYTTAFLTAPPTPCCAIPPPAVTPTRTCHLLHCTRRPTPPRVARCTAAFPRPPPPPPRTTHTHTTPPLPHYRTDARD